jgi:hypothetical protein
MAGDPKAKRITVTFPKGTLSASIGFIEYLLGDQKLTWKAPSTPSPTPDGRRRRVYGTKQRGSARGGREMTFVLRDGSSWVARTTGADLDLLDFVLQKIGEDKVLNVYTKRGTIYGPQFPDEATP